MNLSIFTQQSKFRCSTLIFFSNNLASAFQASFKQAGSVVDILPHLGFGAASLKRGQEGKPTKAGGVLMAGNQDVWKAYDNSYADDNSYAG